MRNCKYRRYVCRCWQLTVMIYLTIQQMREHAALERLEENQELILAFEEERLQPHEHVDKVSLMLSEVEGTGRQ